MRIVLFGEPGVGKGTLATKLSEKFSSPRLSTGDLFRQNIAQGTPLGMQVKGILDAGQLVPDAIVLDVVSDLFSHDYANGFILDGFPRTIPQAIAFDHMLEENKWNLDAVIRIHVSEDEIVHRLSARRQCVSCGTAYNLVASPPKVAWTCDKCGGKLEQRPDDEPQVVRERLRVYMDQTQAVVDYYKEKGWLKEVDAGGLSVEESFSKVLATIGK